MEIDEERKYPLTNYTGKIKESDHFTMIFEAKLSHERKVMERVELFNFKNQKCQEIFYEKSSNRMELFDCFQTEDSVVVQGAKWFKSLNNCLKSLDLWVNSMTCHDAWKRLVKSSHKLSKAVISCQKLS